MGDNNAGKCVMGVMENGKIRKYTCDEVRENQDKWKKEYRERNSTDKCIRLLGMDRQYNQYCGSIDEFLYDKCKCKPIELTCSKCLPEDHEGHFCRCENRNMKLAKQLRYQDKGSQKNEM